jgi:hypothetical protein
MERLCQKISHTLDARAVRAVRAEERAGRIVSPPMGLKSAW